MAEETMTKAAAMPNRAKMTKVQREALAECARWADSKRPFWWRNASMRQLEAKGLVERTRHPTSERRDWFTPTPAGRAALSEVDHVDIADPPPYTASERRQMIAEAITEHWGERCTEYASGCPCCEVWAGFDELASEDPLPETKGIAAA